MMNHSENKEHKDHLVWGVVSAGLAFLAFAPMSACVKILSETHHVMELVFYRSLIALVPFLIYIILAKQWGLFKPSMPFILLLRVLAGTTGMILTFFSLKYLPLADATAIFLTSVLITPVLAFFLLKEKMGRYRWSAIMVGFGGALLLAQPSGDVMTLGLILAFITAFSHSIVQILLRFLKTESPVTTSLYFMLGGFVLGALFMPFVGSLPTKGDTILFLIMGITGAAGQYFLTNAFKYAQASVITPLSYTGLIWAALLDIFIWSVIPGWPIFLGSAIILAAQLYVIHRSKIKGLEPPKI